MRQAAAPAGLALAGVVVLIATGASVVGTVIGTVLLGAAAVVTVSLVFYAVGKSEDRERERERRERQPPH